MFSSSLLESVLVSVNILFSLCVTGVVGSVCVFVNLSLVLRQLSWKAAPAAAAAAAVAAVINAGRETFYQCWQQ